MRRFARVFLAVFFTLSAIFSESQQPIVLHNAPTPAGWGFIDEHGAFQSDHRFVAAEPFSEGFAAVSDGKKFGFVNSSGVVVIPFRYEDVQPFSDGLACVKIAGRWGFIDKTGRVVIQPSLEKAADFIDGFAAVFPVDTKSLEGNFLNKAGKFVLLRHGYDAVIHYGDHLAWVSNFEFGQEYWRVIDRNQRWVSEKLTSCSLLPKYFSEGLAALQRTCSAKWGFVDRTGKQCIPAIFDDVHPFSEGLAAVKVAGKWGYISLDGAIRITPLFDEVGDFFSGFAPASIGGKVGYISQTGQWIIPAQFVVAHVDGGPMSAGNFKDGLALLVIRDGSGERDLSMEYIDKKGKIVYGPAHMTGL